MTAIRTDDAASRARAKLQEEQAGTGQAGRADASHQAHAAAHPQESAQATGKNEAGRSDKLEAGGAPGSNKFAPRPATEAKGASQEHHDQQAREATESQKLSDFLKTEQLKRV